MKYFVILFIGIFTITNCIRTRSSQAATNAPANNPTSANNTQPNATQPNVTQPTNATQPNATAEGNMTFADNDNIVISSTVLPNIYLSADVSNCTQADKHCGALSGYMENNPENRFTLRALSNMQNAFCIAKNNNTFVHFDPSNCTQNSQNASMCALVGFMNSTECKEDYAFRFNRTGQNYAIESVKNPNLYLYFDVENCRGIMNQPEGNATAGNATAANNTAGNNTAVTQQRCGRVEMWNIPNLAEMVNTNENLKAALFEIIKENAQAGNRTIPSVPL